MSRRAFVLGACIANGGTYMAYQLGRILQLDFGYLPVAVLLDHERWDYSKHAYEHEFPTVSTAAMENEITDDDVLVVNPSFSDRMYGLRISGLKICYVQGFTTFNLLDCRFDHYVAASDFVGQFLFNTYGISAPVIPPFLDENAMPQPRAWTERPKSSFIVYRKGPPAIVDLFLDRLRRLVSNKVSLNEIVDEMSLPRTELLSRLASHQYLLSLSPAEGFGLVPLEAMALNTVVIGFDGFGGRHFLKNMHNCAVAPYPNFELIAEHILNLAEDQDTSALLAANASVTARSYSYDRFRSAWRQYFSNILK